MDFIKDKKGQWAHPGKNTLIPDANGRITMDGVNQPVLGIDDKGNQEIMMPGGEYQFPGNDVYEIPLPKHQWGKELIKNYVTPAINSIFKPAPINTIPTSKLTLGSGYQDLYSRVLPQSFGTGYFSNDRLTQVQTRLSDFNEFRNTSFADWQKEIKNYDNKTILPEETLLTFDEPKWKTSQNKNGIISQKQFQSLINSINKPNDQMLLQQTFDEFVTATRSIPEGTINPQTGKMEIPEYASAIDKSVVFPVSNKEPGINFDIFKTAVNDKIATFTHTLSDEEASTGVNRLGYTYANEMSGTSAPTQAAYDLSVKNATSNSILQNKTIILKSELLGPTIATGDGSVTNSTHFRNDKDVYGHIRFLVDADNPQQFKVLETQADEMQQYNKINKSVTQLTYDNVIWNRLQQGEQELVAQEFFDKMWINAQSPEGFLKVLGIEGGITPNSTFPLVTNLIADETWSGVNGFLNSGFPTGANYAERMGHKHWDNSGKFPVNSADMHITFNSYEDVLKYRESFLDEFVAKHELAGDGVTKEIIGDHIKDNQVRINDLITSTTTDATKVSGDQLIRNLQKKQYLKNQQQRLFNEAVIYAVNNGFKEIAYPTQETAADIQGFYPIGQDHLMLENPWTRTSESEFMNQIHILTSERGYQADNAVVVKSGGNPEFMPRRFGNMVYIPRQYASLPESLKKGQVVHNRYETGPPGHIIENDLSGFQQRFITMDIPKSVNEETGLYKIEADGSWTMIQRGTSTGTSTSLASVDGINNELESIMLSYESGNNSFQWTNTAEGGYNRKESNLYNALSEIRNENHIELQDPNVFNPTAFKSNQNRVLESYDNKAIEKLIFKGLGNNYPYRIETDKRGKKWIIFGTPDSWTPDAKIGKFKSGGEILPKYQDKGEVKVNYDNVEKGIRHIESLDGVLMKNKESSASGLYGQLFNDIEYDGTRDEFILDQEYQKELFNKRYNGEIEGVPGLETNGVELYKEYKDQIDNFNLTPTQIAAISNMLGRQGTRNYLGNVLRDGMTLEEGVPSAYGPDKPSNKTPDEFIELFNDSLKKKKIGGEIRDGIISDMLDEGAFLNKFKMGAEMQLKGSIGGYGIKKSYDETHRLPYIQFNSNDGEIVDNRIYYDKDDVDGTDNFNIIDIDSQVFQQDREHERVKQIIKKYDAQEKLLPVEENYLKELGLLDNQVAETTLSIPTEGLPRMQGKEIRLEDISVRKDLYNKSDNNNKGISLKKQIEFYDAHVNNLYSHYKLEPKVRKIYDRLNSLYYNDAKATSMTVFDYIKSLNN